MREMTAAPGAPTAGATGMQRSTRSWWRRAAWWLALLALVAVTVPAIARLTGWETGPLAWVVAVMPWFTFATVVPLVLALLARSWPVVAASGVVAVLGLAWLAPLYVPNFVPGDLTLTVASANLLYGEADADAVVAMVRNRDIDVLAVQELTPDEVGRLRAAGLDELMPYSVLDAAWGAGGSGLWSRVPLSQPSTVEGLTFNAVRAEAVVNGRSLAVFSVHAAPPGTQTHESWTADLDRLAEVLDAETGATVVAGDFNATRDHRGFRAIEGLGFADAADQAGAGFVPTFPEGRLPTPVVAIDHVLVRDAPWGAKTVTAVALPGADHRALVVTYVGE